MPFETNIPNNLLLGDQEVVFGTVALGEEFGQIMKCNLERTGKEIEIENNKAGLRAMILANPGYALDMEVNFDAGVEPPGPGDPIEFPYAGVIGRVLFGGKITWDSKTERKLSFKAAYWDSMGVDDELLAYAIADDGSTSAYPPVAP